MIKYETELRELVEFVLEMADLEEYLCSKFEEGLNLEIREKMSVSGSHLQFKIIFQLHIYHSIGNLFHPIFGHNGVYRFRKSLTPQ